MILRKPGPLTPEERDIMRTHCEIGYNMVKRIPFPCGKLRKLFCRIRNILMGRVTRADCEDIEIPLGARIFAVADALDAMISDRVYRKALSIRHAQEEIRAARARSLTRSGSGSFHNHGFQPFGPSCGKISERPTGYPN